MRFSCSLHKSMAVQQAGCACIPAPVLFVVSSYEDRIQEIFGNEILKRLEAQVRVYERYASPDTVFFLSSLDVWYLAIAIPAPIRHTSKKISVNRKNFRALRFGDVGANPLLFSWLLALPVASRPGFSRRRPADLRCGPAERPALKFDLTFDGESILRVRPRAKGTGGECRRSSIGNV